MQSAIVVTWEKEGVVAAFGEEWRRPSWPVEGVTAAFAGSVGEPRWALWPWWAERAREAGCVRIMDYGSMAALDAHPGAERNRNKILFRGYALQALIESELAAIDAIERRDMPHAEWLVQAASRHPHGKLVQDQAEAARLGQVLGYHLNHMHAPGEQDYTWTCTAAEIARQHARNGDACPGDATLLLLRRLGYRLRLDLEGVHYVEKAEGSYLDWLAESRLYWLGLRHDMQAAAATAAAAAPLTRARLDELAAAERAHRDQVRAEMKRKMAAYEVAIKEKRLDALLIGLAAVIVEASFENGGYDINKHGDERMWEARRLYDASMELGWWELGAHLSHRWEL